jgi:hypothetical protein
MNSIWPSASYSFTWKESAGVVAAYVQNMFSHCAVKIWLPVVPSVLYEKLPPASESAISISSHRGAMTGRGVPDVRLFERAEELSVAPGKRQPLVVAETCV